MRLLHVITSLRQRSVLIQEVSVPCRLELLQIDQPSLRHPARLIHLSIRKVVRQAWSDNVKLPIYLTSACCRELYCQRGILNPTLFTVVKIGQRQMRRCLC